MNTKDKQPRALLSSLSFFALGRTSSPPTVPPLAVGNRRKKDQRDDDGGHEGKGVVVRVGGTDGSCVVVSLCGLRPKD